MNTVTGMETTDADLAGNAKEHPCVKARCKMTLESEESGFVLEKTNALMLVTSNTQEIAILRQVSLGYEFSLN